MPHIDDRIKQDIMNIHNVTNGEPKEIMKLINGNAQAPKFLSQKYGAGALQVLFPQKHEGGRISGQAVYVNNSRFYCNCSIPKNRFKGIEKLETIYNIRKRRPNFIFKRVYNLISSDELFIIAYQNLKSKKGIITPGTDGQTADEFSIKEIQNITELLKTQRFEFKPSRRVLIPKPRDKSRPLSIPSFRDKLVQEVIRIILEAIYEPTFSPYSHGFRKGKRCHSALKDIRVTFAGVKWLITRDIEKCFDSINHHKLVEILAKRTTDQRFLDLV